MNAKSNQIVTTENNAVLVDAAGAENVALDVSTVPQDYPSFIRDGDVACLPPIFKGHRHESSGVLVAVTTSRDRIAELKRVQANMAYAKEIVGTVFPAGVFADASEANKAVAFMRWIKAFAAKNGTPISPADFARAAEEKARREKVEQDKQEKIASTVFKDSVDFRKFAELAERQRVDVDVMINVYRKVSLAVHNFDIDEDAHASEAAEHFKRRFARFSSANYADTDQIAFLNVLLTKAEVFRKFLSQESQNAGLDCDRVHLMNTLAEYVRASVRRIAKEQNPHLRGIWKEKTVRLFGRSIAGASDSIGVQREILRGEKAVEFLSGFKGLWTAFSCGSFQEMTKSSGSFAEFIALLGPMLGAEETVVVRIFPADIFVDVSIDGHGVLTVIRNIETIKELRAISWKTLEDNRTLYKVKSKSKRSHYKARVFATLEGLQQELRKVARETDANLTFSVWSCIRKQSFNVAVTKGGECDIFPDA